MIISSNLIKLFGIKKKEIIASKVYGIGICRALG
jgi:hypothetical protein